MTTRRDVQNASVEYLFLSNYVKVSESEKSKNLNSSTVVR